MSVLEILNAAWAIKPAYLEMIQNIYLERREHKLGAAELREIEAAVGRPLNNNADRRYSVQDGVAIIPVMGSMVLPPRLMQTTQTKKAPEFQGLIY